MKYFLDTEFIEGTQKTWFGQTKPTIDLISIGIVCEDGREYYAISKDFNIKEAWNRYDKIINKQYPLGPQYNKVYWIRDNILKPIFDELNNNETNGLIFNKDNSFTYKNFKRLINKYSKSNKQIAEEIKMFIAQKGINGGFGTKLPLNNSNEEYEDRITNLLAQNTYYKPEFYSYYADYDWVVFCWLFGNMVDLPKGFPMYCIDLKQISDEVLDIIVKEENSKAPLHNTGIPKWKRFINDYDIIKKHPDYPKQTNKHNALDDAKWNYELYKFLNKL